jgi:uncharacterized protein
MNSSNSHSNSNGPCQSWKRYASMIFRWFKKEQYELYLAGCVAFSFGANAFIASHLGTDPLDVFSLGLKKHMPMTIGIAQGGFAALCLIVWGIWNRRRPPLSPFFTFFFCGSLIDLWMWSGIANQLRLGPYLLLLLGVMLCGIGSALIIMSGIGIRAMDLVAITMYERLSQPFWLCKGILEVMLLVSGWLMGGPVGIGTVAFLGVVGWSIQPMMWFAGRYFSLPNYGLRSPSAIADELVNQQV